MTLPNLKWGVYLTTSAGFLTLILLPDISPVAIGIFLFVLIPSWFIAHEAEPFVGYSRGWSVASILFILFTLGLIFFQIMPIHVIFAYQIGFLQISKAFNPKKSRDILLMWVLSFLMIVITAVLTRSAIFPIFLFLFVILSIYTLIWLNIQRDAERVRASRKKSASPGGWIDAAAQPDALTGLDTLLRFRGVPPSFRRTISFSSFLVTLISLLIFLLIPRMSPKYSSVETLVRSPSEQTVLIGFSTEINLGGLRNILENPQPVMRVRIHDKRVTAENLYLRGGAFDLFTGTSWIKSQYLRKYDIYNVNPNTRFISLVSVPRGVKSVEDFGVKQSSKVIKQEIAYIDFPSRYIFSLPHLVMITNMSESSERVFRDNSGTVFILPPKAVIRYEAYSLESGFPDEDETAALSNPSFTYIPKNLDENRLTHLASSVAGRATTSFEKARRIESFLRNDYQYSLRVGSSRNDNPLEDFLFASRSGHCELFATSMLMLLRTQGIPCRLAFGFHGGAYDEREGTFLIRQNNAHTWVEAYDGEEGWVRFDPTPPAPMAVYGDRLYFKKLADFFASLARKWEEFTFGYDDSRRVVLARKIYEYAKKTGGALLDPLLIHIRKNRAIRRLTGNLSHPFIIWLAIFLFIFNVSAIILYRRLNGFRRIKADSPMIPRFRQTGGSFYASMIRGIAGRFLQRPGHLTAQEFVFETGKRFGAPVYILEEGSRLYYALRYGPEGNIPRLSKETEAFLKSLKDFRKGMI